MLEIREIMLPIPPKELFQSKEAHVWITIVKFRNFSLQMEISHFWSEGCLNSMIDVVSMKSLDPKSNRTFDELRSLMEIYREFIPENTFELLIYEVNDRPRTL